MRGSFCGTAEDGLKVMQHVGGVCVHFTPTRNTHAHVEEETHTHTCSTADGMWKCMFYSDDITVLAR